MLIISFTLIILPFFRFLNKHVESNDLIAVMKDAFSRQDDKTLVLRADKNVPYGVVVDVMDAAKGAGLRRIVAPTILDPEKQPDRKQSLPVNSLIIPMSKTSPGCASFMSIVNAKGPLSLRGGNRLKLKLKQTRRFLANTLGTSSAIRAMRLLRCRSPNLFMFNPQ